MIKDKSIIYNKDEIVAEWNIELNLDYDHLLVGMSGGMDSSILYYMMAYHMDKNNLSGTLHAYSCIHEERPWQAHHAKKVIKYVKEQFPNIKYGVHTIATTPGTSYIDNGTALQWKTSYELAQSDGGTVATYNGVTLNPPDELGKYIWRHSWGRRAVGRDVSTLDKWEKVDGEQIEHNNEDFFVKAGLHWEEDGSLVHWGTNDEEQEQAARDHNEYHIQHYPFCTQDKRVVLAFYKKYGQLISLGELTNSCEGHISMRGDPKYSKPCHWCWWCIEKEWATSEIFHYDPIKSMEDWPAFHN
jgi:hypothetical protein